MNKMKLGKAFDGEWYGTIDIPILRYDDVTVKVHIAVKRAKTFCYTFAMDNKNYVVMEDLRHSLMTLC